jgi:hypothetical protein
LRPSFRTPQFSNFLAQSHASNVASLCTFE